jgi:hypothetical protein
MLRPSGKAAAIAKNVLKNQGVKVPKPKANIKEKENIPYLQH